MDRVIEHPINGEGKPFREWRESKYRSVAKGSALFDNYALEGALSTVDCSGVIQVEVSRMYSRLEEGASQK